MKIIVAITAASGAIYARQLLECLISSAQVEQIALIHSTNAEAVAQVEGVTLPESSKIIRYANDNLFASVASGSAEWNAMVIVPSSVGTMSRVATGVSQTLIERAADVMLKQRRKLVMSVRETPIHGLHLKNMQTVVELGAVVLPPMLTYYIKPKSIEEMTHHITGKILDEFGIECSGFQRWCE